MSGISLHKHFSLLSANDITQICSPLKDIGITYFNYIKIYNDGSRELLTSNAEWIDHFYKNSLYNSIGAVDIERLLPKGYFLWSELNINDPIYLQGRDFFNIDNGISFVNKLQNYTVLYIFASDKDNYKINNFYIRNIDLLKRFIYYFKDAASVLIRQASKNKIYLPEVQKPEVREINLLNVNEKSREIFFRKTETTKLFLFDENQDVYLTRKQAECAAYAIKGFTAKECAKKLGISFRTVEEHWSDIRNKLLIVTGVKPNHKEMLEFLKDKWIERIFPYTNCP